MEYDFQFQKGLRSDGVIPSCCVLWLRLAHVLISTSFSPYWLLTTQFVMMSPPSTLLVSGVFSHVDLAKNNMNETGFVPNLLRFGKRALWPLEQMLCALYSHVCGGPYKLTPDSDFSKNKTVVAFISLVDALEVESPCFSMCSSCGTLCSWNHSALCCPLQAAPRIPEGQS